MNNDISISRSDAEKVTELLEGFSLLLRSSLPDRLFELLKTLDQTGVYQPLRYDIPMGPPYVADEADAIARRLRSDLEGGA